MTIVFVFIYPGMLIEWRLILYGTDTDPVRLRDVNKITEQHQAHAEFGTDTEDDGTQGGRSRSRGHVNGEASSAGGAKITSGEGRQEGQEGGWIHWGGQHTTVSSRLLAYMLEDLMEDPYI